MTEYQQEIAERDSRYIYFPRVRGDLFGAEMVTGVKADALYELDRLRKDRPDRQFVLGIEAREPGESVRDAALRLGIGA